jgi:hypothetical protein
MKIIFLDIDGVINTSSSGSPGTGPKPKLNKSVIDALNLIIEDLPEARFVLSSRWRVDYGYSETVKYLKSSGFNGIFVGQTPNFDKPSTESLKPRRRYEIQKYLDDNNITGEFVIIDDNADLGRLSSRQIRTRWSSGFTAGRVKDVLRILQR